MTHPLILAYGKTYEKEFPIILIVGREPNNGTVSDGTLGSYDFKIYPKCSFWNIAFKLFGSINLKTTSEVKNKFLLMQSSPIVFTDASSKGILNEVIDKNIIRNSIMSSGFTKVDSIFTNKKLMKRVKLILLSGLSNNVYSDFKNILISEATKIQIPVKEISFLYGTNYPKIQNEIGEMESSIIREVFLKFWEEDSNQ